MAYSRRKKKSSRKNKKSEIFQNIGAAWENETKNGDVLISLKIDIEDFLDWLDLMKLDKLPDEETKLSIILLEQTKSKKRGAPDFVAYGLDPTLPEGEEEEEEEKPKRRKKKKKVRREEPEEEYEEEEEEEEKPKKRKKKRAKKVKEEEEELELDFNEEDD